MWVYKLQGHDRFAFDDFWAWKNGIDTAQLFRYLKSQIILIVHGLEMFYKALKHHRVYLLRGNQFFCLWFDLKRCLVWLTRKYKKPIFLHLIRAVSEFLSCSIILPHNCLPSGWSGCCWLSMFLIFFFRELWRAIKLFQAHNLACIIILNLLKLFL